MPLGRYLRAGHPVGLGSDVAAGPEVSLFSVMRAGAYTQNALHVLPGMAARSGLPPIDWLRLATLGGARALGLEDEIGSVEAGKEADLIVVDPRPPPSPGTSRAATAGRPEPADLRPAGHGARRLGSRAAARHRPAPNRWLP